MIFFRKNKSFIIILVLSLLWVILCLMQENKRLHEQKNSYNDVVDYCKNNNEDWCKEILNSEFKNSDTITEYLYLLCYSSLSYLEILAPLLIIIPTSHIFIQFSKRGYIKNMLTRMKYKKFISKLCLNLSKNLLIFPIILFTLFIGCAIITNFNFNYIGELNNPSNLLSIVDSSYFQFPISVLKYMLIIILNTILYINITLMVTNRCKNVWLSIATSYLVFIFLALISEIFIGSLICSILLKLPQYSGIFNLFGFWIPIDTPNINFALMYSLILSILSSLFSYVIFKNKELVVISNEN